MPQKLSYEEMQRRKRINKILLPIVGVLLVLVIIAYFSGDSNKQSPPATTHVEKNTTEETPALHEAWYISQHYVKKILKAPATAEFEPDDVVGYHAHDTFVIKASVDAQNSYGALIRSPYNCIMVYKGGDKYDLNNWELLHVALQEQ